MTVLLEWRDKIKKIYARYAVFVLPIVKFLISFIVINTVNVRLGYMGKLDNIAIVLIVSLVCSLLPFGFLVFFGALFSLLHMYQLSLEVAILGVCLYLILYLLFFRFCGKDALVIALTPILFLMKIPYVLPVLLGLVSVPVVAISLGCGVIIYYFLETVIAVGPTVRTMAETEASAKIKLVIDTFIGNKTMLVIIAAFAVTVIVVYLLRRLSVEYSWTIAMIAGAVVDVVILLVGDLLYDINISVMQIILCGILAVGLGKILEFFRFCVDYSRAEKLQFEDDEYYYYVKAIPKMIVAAPEKSVKKINTQTRAHSETPRNVVTERTARRPVQEGASEELRRKPENSLGSRSMTISSTDEDEDYIEFEDELADDFEDLF